MTLGNVSSESDEPEGFRGLSSLVSVLPEAGSGATPSKPLVQEAHPPSLLKATSLTEHASGKSVFKTAGIAFVLAFVLTGVILVILR